MRASELAADRRAAAAPPRRARTAEDEVAAPDDEAAVGVGPYPHRASAPTTTLVPRRRPASAAIGRHHDRWGIVSEPNPLRGVEEPTGREPRVVEFPVAQTAGRAAYVAGTFDTKGRELFYPAQLPREARLAHRDRRPRDLRQAVAGDGASARSGAASSARRGARSSPATAAPPSREWRTPSSTSSRGRRDLGGLISAGGSGGTALATQAMRRLPIGIPKVMVSTVASGDVKPYVGPVRHLHDVFGDRHLRASTASRRRCWPMRRMRSPA